MIVMINFSNEEQKKKKKKEIYQRQRNVICISFLGLP